MDHEILVNGGMMNSVKGIVASLLLLCGGFAFAEDQTAVQKQVAMNQSAGKTQLLDFTASWCPTCRVQKKVLARLKDAGDLAGVELVEVDYDDESALKKAFGVNSQSTFVMLQGLVETKRATGLTSEDDIRQFVIAGAKPIALSEKLQAMSDASASKIPPEKLEVMKKEISKLKEMKLAEKSLQVGKVAPLFSLKDAKGKQTRLKTLLKKGPVVLTFYRGAWCPYCNEQLRSYQKVLPEIQRLGGQLVAITPELPSSVLSMEEKNALQFSILSDPRNRTAKKYGLVMGISPELKKIYQDFGINLEKSQGNKDWKLPLPATYVIGKNGKVVYAFVDVDYKKRAEPDAILGALEKLSSEAK
jgi:peroxiredoxin/glutaredoxin